MIVNMIVIAVNPAPIENATNPMVIVSYFFLMNSLTLLLFSLFINLLLMIDLMMVKRFEDCIIFGLGITSFEVFILTLSIPLFASAGIARYAIINRHIMIIRTDPPILRFLLLFFLLVPLAPFGVVLLEFSCATLFSFMKYSLLGGNLVLCFF